MIEEKSATERLLITRVFGACAWKQVKASHQLGIRNTLKRKMDDLGIKRV